MDRFLLRAETPEERTNRTERWERDCARMQYREEYAPQLAAPVRMLTTSATWDDLTAEQQARISQSLAWQHRVYGTKVPDLSQSRFAIYANGLAVMWA